MNSCGKGTAVRLSKVVAGKSDVTDSFEKVRGVQVLIILLFDIYVSFAIVLVSTAVQLFWLFEKLQLEYIQGGPRSIW